MVIINHVTALSDPLMFVKVNLVTPLSEHNTRSSHNIPLPIPSTTLIKNSIIHNSKKVFNHLPVYLKTMTNQLKFRKELKKILLKKGYYSLDEFFEDSI